MTFVFPFDAAFDGHMPVHIAFVAVNSTATLGAGKKTRRTQHLLATYKKERQRLSDKNKTNGWRSRSFLFIFPFVNSNDCV